MSLLVRRRVDHRVVIMRNRSVSRGATATTTSLAIAFLLAVLAANAAGPPKVPQSPGRYPAVGDQVRALPPGYRTIKVDRHNYRYHDGSFYRPGPEGAYVVVRAPIGAQVSFLSPGYVSFGIGTGHYFFANFTYYMWNADRTGYVVVEKPEGAETAIATANATGESEVFVYPNKEQSKEQQDRDRYECYRWAVDQTGFDPVAGESDVVKAGDYRRALSACLEGRGYTVR